MADPADNRTELQRAIAERAREFSVDSRRPRPQRYGQYAITLVLAILVVGLVLLGFDTFLSSMQKLIAIMGTDPVPTGPVPVYMVPEPPHPP
jgi:hypothetical protein